MANQYIDLPIQSSAPLPAGAATAANQVLEIAALNSIDSKLTSPIAVSQSGLWSVTLNSGSNTIGKVDQGLGGASPWLVTGPLTDAQLRATPVPVSGTLTTLQGTSPWVISGTVTSNIGTTGGLALDTTVAGLLTNTQLRASPVPVSLASTTITGTVAVTQSTSPWVISGSVTANAGANLNTSALNLETTQSAINAKLPSTLGQKTMANSLAIVIASDQTAVPASQSGTWNITNVSGTVSLPTGASTSALQTTGNTSLASIDSKMTASTATIFNIARSTSSAVALAANANRKGCLFVNDTGAICYISYAATSSTTSYTFRLTSNAFYEMAHPTYTGVISVIFASGGANTLNITELT